MALPFSPNTTYVPGSTPSIKAQDLNDMQVWLAFLFNNRGVSALYGNGADGAATLNASSAAPAWATKATTLVGINGTAVNLTVFTLTRDVFFTGLTISGPNVAIHCGSFRIYVNGTLTLGASCWTLGNGTTTSLGGAAGTPIAVAAKTVAGQVAGGQGASTVGAGSAGASLSTAALGGAGGAGGADGGGHAGGAGGSVVPPVPAYGGLNVYSPPVFGCFAGGGLMTLVNGGGGGGGAGGNSTNSPGGGNGGGVLCVAARFMSLPTASAIQAAGGYGAQVNPTGNNGGGGGGGGGVLILVYETLTITDSTTMSSATNCPGGLASAATGTGVAGSAGAAGTLVLIAA